MYNYNVYKYNMVVNINLDNIRVLCVFLQCQWGCENYQVGPDSTCQHTCSQGWTAQVRPTPLKYKVPRTDSSSVTRVFDFLC